MNRIPCDQYPHCYGCPMLDEEENCGWVVARRREQPEAVVQTPERLPRRRVAEALVPAP